MSLKIDTHSELLEPENGTSDITQKYVQENRKLAHELEKAHLLLTAQAEQIALLREFNQSLQRLLPAAPQTRKNNGAT